MSVETFPEANAAAVDIPLPLTVGESDRDGRAAVEAAAGSGHPVGLAVRLVMLQGNGRRPNIDFARLDGEVAHPTMVP
ncbi:MAG TPA: hypothetical protein VFI11_14635 [Anaerolineales bacterium]|nr:hypothetical protein [Anaerolineales bacterium]